jgi:hypothetical protein
MERKKSLIIAALSDRRINGHYCAATFDQQSSAAVGFTVQISEAAD